MAHHRFIDRIAVRNAVAAALMLALASCAGGGKDEAKTPYEITLAAAASEGRDYGQAVQLWTNALALKTLTPDQRARALFARAGAYWNTGKRDPAFADISAAIALKPDMAELFMLRGAFYFAAHDYGHAADDFDAAIKLKADAAEAHTGRAEVRIAQRQYAQAIPDLDIAIGFKPYLAGSYILRGEAYLELGNTDRAMQDFDQAVQRHPGDVAPLRARWLAEYKLGRYQQAAADLEKAVVLKPDDPYLAIWLHLTQQRLKAADGAELARSAGTVDLTKWPGQVISLYRGSATAEQVLAAAAATEAAEPKNQKCEADFYVGQYLSSGKKTDEGRRLLKAARDTCPGDFYEFRLAEIALAN